MKPFATLLDRLVPHPLAQCQADAAVDYFRLTPDPDRVMGWRLLPERWI